MLFNHMYSRAPQLELLTSRPTVRDARTGGRSSARSEVNRRLRGRRVPTATHAAGDSARGPGAADGMVFRGYLTGTMRCFRSP
jgi:hypothetical protein